MRNLNSLQMQQILIEKEKRSNIDLKNLLINF